MKQMLQSIPIAVYTAFDHLPMQKKELPFLVLNLSKWKTDAVAWREYATCIPFSAIVDLTLLLPQTANAQTLFDSLIESILPALVTGGCNIQQIEISAPKTDPILKKQTITAHCTVIGCYARDMQEVS